MQHLTMDLESLSLKFNITDGNIVFYKKYLISRKTGKSCQEVKHSSKSFDSYYMDSVCYETCDKLIWTSEKCFRNTNTTINQGITKINMSMKSPSSTLGFGCPPP